MSREYTNKLVAMMEMEGWADDDEEYDCEDATPEDDFVSVIWVESKES